MGDFVLRSGKYFLLGVVSLLAVNGCAERGYELSVQPHTSVVSAQAQIDKGKEENSIFEKMVDAVLEEQQKSAEAQEAEAEMAVESADEITQGDQEALQSVRPSHDEQAAKRTKSAISLYPKSSSVSKKSATLSSTEETDELLKVAKELEEAIKRKKAEKQSNLNKTAKEGKNSEAQQALSMQSEKEPFANKEEESKDLPKSDTVTATKAELSKESNSTQAKKRDIGTKRETKKRDRIYAKSMLRFIPIDKTFVKFGTSEIHGHVIYLKGGENIPLYRPVAYLVQKNSLSRYWYEHYYLKNRIPDEQVTLTYIDKSEVDFENNFSFYGVAKGSYYVVIVAKNPHQLSRSIVIAKKIDVDKFKKVIAVFSKKVE